MTHPLLFFFLTLGLLMGVWWVFKVLAEWLSTIF